MGIAARPNMAVIYDFDGTLAPGNMQERQFIPNLGLTPGEFWEKVNEMTHDRQADPILTYMYVMLQLAQKAGIVVHERDLNAQARGIKFFPGVTDWFQRMNRRAAGLGIALRHFVVSSGNAEIIEATPIAGEFHRVYASRFLYDDDGIAVWPAVAINFTNKTQYLFRVNKGALDQDDLEVINRKIPHHLREVPFENMIYLGDGETDVPCFRVMMDAGGMAVAVHGPGGEENARGFLRDGRVDLAAPADYREGSLLDRAVTAQMELVAARARLQKQMENGREE